MNALEFQKKHADVIESVKAQKNTGGTYIRLENGDSFTYQLSGFGEPYDKPKSSGGTFKLIPLHFLVNGEVKTIDVSGVVISQLIQKGGDVGSMVTIRRRMPNGQSTIGLLEVVSTEPVSAIKKAVELTSDPEEIPDELA